MARRKQSDEGKGMVFGSVGGTVADWYGQNRYVTVGVGMIGIVVLAVIVPVAIYHSIAATGATSIEAENGAVSSQASTFTDSNASNGQYVQFGSGSTGGNVAGMDTSCVFASAPAGTTRAFCDGFNSPTAFDARFARSGELNGLIWGASRADGDTSQWPVFDTNSHTVLDENLNHNVVSNSGPLCGQTGSFPPPSDIKVCGHVETGLQSGGGVVSIAMYPKQPFDFNGRTGTIVFDVSGDSHGSHDIWPEFWLTDKPVPDPFKHATSWASIPQNGFAIRFDASCIGGGCAPNCPAGNPGDYYVNISDSSVFRNYVKDVWDYPGAGAPHSIQYDHCIKEPVTGDGKMNHIELRVSQNQIDIYGTNAQTPSLMTPSWIAANLQHMATMANTNLTMTKGLIWIADAQYNPEKGDGTHFFHRSLWDNVGFDGPKTYRDLAYDVPNGAPSAAAYTVGPHTSKTLTVKSVDKGTADKGASACATTPCALLVFNFAPFDGGGPSLSHTYTINGHTATAITWPFGTPDKTGVDAEFVGNSPRTIGIPIDISDVVNGDNTITFTNNSNSTINYLNVGLIMVNAAPVP